MTRKLFAVTAYETQLNPRLAGMALFVSGFAFLAGCGLAALVLP